MLENLTTDDARRIIQKIKNHVRYGFVITVPARELLLSHMVTCSRCSQQYHAWGHIRRFDRFEDIDALVGQTAVERIFIPYTGVNASLVIESLRRSLGQTPAFPNASQPVINF